MSDILSETREAAFVCPHCKETVYISSDVFGEVVNCPECDGEFKAHVPVAQAVTSSHKTPPEGTVVRKPANEERLLREVHPVQFRNHLFLTTIALLLAVAGIVAMIYRISDDALYGLEEDVLLFSGIGALALSAAYFLTQWIRKIRTTVQITTRRTIVVRGIISRNTNEVQHDDVRNIRSDRNILERMLNYGDLALSSAGQGDMEIVVHDIPDPGGVIEIIRRNQ